MPPSERVWYMLGVCTKITIKFVEELGRLWCGKCWQRIEDVGLLYV
jgi:hypothetical protein